MHFEDGIYFAMPNADYHSSDGFSRSRLMALSRNYRHFKYASEQPYKEPTDAMNIGSAVHIMVLEPQLEKELIIPMPEFNKRTKDGRADYEAFKSKHAGKVLLDEEDYLKSSTMASRLINRIESEMEGYLANSVNEASIFFTFDGIQYKCRPDSFVKGIVIDIKTTKDASKRSLTRDAIDSGYLMQAAMIKIGLATIGQELISYGLACVENNEPYSTALYMLDEDAMEFGNKQFLSLHTKLKQYLEKEPEFIDYDTDYLTLPNWVNYLELDA